MAKRSRTTRIKVIKNMDRIGSGNKLPVVKDQNGKREWAASVEAGKKQVSKSVPPNVNALKSTTNLTSPAKAMRTAKSPKVAKGATELIASQKNVKPAIKPPAPAKKPPTPGR